MANESWVLDGLSLTDGTDLRMEDAELTPGKKLIDLVTSPNSDGGVLLEEPRTDNVTLTWRLRVPRQATTDGSLAKLGLLQDKLEECSKNNDGLALIWTPQDSTQAYTLYVLAGQIVGLPMKTTGNDAGWFLRSPVVTVETVCKPFLYLPEELLGSATGSDPLVTVTLADVPGDVPAEGRIFVTENGNQARRHLEGGLEQRHYNAATSLIRDSASLATSGFSGTSTTRTGAYSSSGVIRSTLYTQPTAVAGTGTLTHVGTYRVKARVWASTTDTRVRLAWQNGDGPFTNNPWVTVPGEDAFYEIDLGTLQIDPVAAGAQQWTGRIEAYHPKSIADTLDVDYLLFIPAGEWYGKARATYTYRPGALVGRDEFTGMTAAAALNARVAPAGGTWATSGVATDFTAIAPVAFNTDVVRRATVSEATPRYAVLGSTNYTDTEVSVNRYRATAHTNASRGGILARWTDASNHLRLTVHTQEGGTDNGSWLYLEKVVAGTATRLAMTDVSSDLNVWQRIHLVVFASGAVIGWVRNAAGAVLAEVAAFDSALATGGTLATGKPGVIDINESSVATTRYYDNFYVAVAAPEPIVLYTSQTAEIRAAGPVAERENSAGTAYGAMPSYRGGRPFIPPAGTAGRTSRLALKARRADIDVSPDANIADSIYVEVYGRPRFRIPRGPV